MTADWGPAGFVKELVHRGPHGQTPAGSRSMSEGRDWCPSLSVPHSSQNGMAENNSLAGAGSSWNQSTTDQANIPVGAAPAWKGTTTGQPSRHTGPSLTRDCVTVGSPAGSASASANYWIAAEELDGPLTLAVRSGHSDDCSEYVYHECCVWQSTGNHRLPRTRQPAVPRLVRALWLGQSGLLTRLAGLPWLVSLPQKLTQLLWQWPWRVRSHGSGWPSSTKTGGSSASNTSRRHT